MTTEYPSRVSVRLSEREFENIGIVGEFEETPQGWRVQLSLGPSIEFGDARVRLAVKMLCSLDAAIVFSLSSRKSVILDIPSRPSTKDGPHPAVEQVAPLLLPLSSEGSLYPFQRTGVAWLLKRNRALLADDMGLGKTVQALCAIRELVRLGHLKWVLVIVPRSLIWNWTAEAERWVPELTVATALSRGTGREADWKRLVRRAHLLLTSYEQLRQLPATLDQYPPDLVIADEAHRFRNQYTQWTIGVRELDVSRIWLLTGTPVERDALDLATLLSILDPQRFSPEDSANIASLRVQARPYILRRRKTDVLDQLPEIIERNEILDLHVEQKAAYNNAIIQFSLSQSEDRFLALFNKLRSLCDVDPDSGASSKLDRIVERIFDITSRCEKVVVFSYLIDPLRHLQIRLDSNLYRIRNRMLTGELTLEERDAVIEDWKENRDIPVLLASSRVSAEGLTLTEANNVIFINRWWNPSGNTQARDRIYRIGQKKQVTVFSFTCRGTVEDRLNDLLQTKNQTYEDLVEVFNQSTLSPKKLLLSD